MKKEVSFTSCFLVIFLFSSPLKAQEQGVSAPSVQPPSIGLFTLPTSQEPGPFFSFGQNIIEKNKLQIYLSPNYLKVDDGNFFAITPSFLYGLTDSASFFLSTPLAIDYRNGTDHSSGTGDTGLQFEYAFYQSSDITKYEFATVVTAVTLPTGSIYKSPPTGFGSPAYFFGATFNRSFIEWFWFVSPGISVTTPYKEIRLGSQYLYQLGIGHDILSMKNKYTFSGLIELNGQYTEKNKVFGQTIPDSGGNVIFIAPSLWFSTQKLIIQLGIALPIFQHLYGDQVKNKYNIAASLGWTFNV
jgi:hypothetical protein